jgi:nuclease S1
MFLRLFAPAAILPVAILAAAPSANGWGCKGHQVVALIAERHLDSRARQMAVELLAAAPTDPDLRRSCPEVGDRLADASTWADDIRRVRPETGPWHFIDVPRGAPEKDLSKYCPPRSGCITSALADELRILRDPLRAPEERAEALRLLIHFVGDIHQPLHASTNNDLGGNCVPVAFFGRKPAPVSPQSAVFLPNLHEVWDVEIIERFSAGESAGDVAKKLDEKFYGSISIWQAQPADFDAWVRESHELAETIAYGRLPHWLPIEPPRAMKACLASDVRAKFKIDESLGDDYQNAAAPVVEQQLAKAGARLAALLNSLWQ